MNGVRLQRRLSEPPLSGRSQSMCTIVSSSLSRERKRSTVVRFEQGKDQALVWFNEWSTKEICSVLSCLIQRCSLNQMKFLWTALESVPHKDFLHQAMRKFPSVAFQPLSTPISRELKARLQRSRYPENKTLFRTQSLLIRYSSSNSSHSYQPTPIPETTPLFTLPGLRSSTASGSIPNQLCTLTDHNSVRTCSPARRHMNLTLSNPGTPSCFLLPTVRTDAWTDPTGYGGGAGPLSGTISNQGRQASVQKDLHGGTVFGNHTVHCVWHNGILGVFPFIVKSCLCFSLYFTYPIMMFPVSEILEKRLNCKRDPTNTDQLMGTVLRFSLVASTGFVVAIIPDFSVLMALVGSTCCILLGFILPAIFHMRIFKNELTNAQLVFDVFLITLGIFGALFGTHDALSRWHSHKSTAIVTHHLSSSVNSTQPTINSNNSLNFDINRTTSSNF